MLVDLKSLDGIHTFIDDILEDSDPTDVITKLVEGNYSLHDNTCHLMTKFAKNFKPSAADKLGRLILERGKPMII